MNPNYLNIQVTETYYTQSDFKLYFCIDIHVSKMDFFSMAEIQNFNNANWKHISCYNSLRITVWYELFMAVHFLMIDYCLETN